MSDVAGQDEAVIVVRSGVVLARGTIRTAAFVSLARFDPGGVPVVRVQSPVFVQHVGDAPKERLKMVRVVENVQLGGR